MLGSRFASIEPLVDFNRVAVTAGRLASTHRALRTSLDLGRADAALAGGVEAYGPTASEGLRRSAAKDFEEASAFVLLGREGAGPMFERADIDALRTTGRVGAAAGALAAVQALERSPSAS